MYKHFQEATKPENYRQAEVAQLLSSLALHRSTQVVALHGLGKSSLLRFLVSHPDLLKRHPNFMAGDVFYLYVDCHKFSPPNALNFYRECYFRLQSAQDPNESTQILANLSDEYLLYKHLELTLANLPLQTSVIFVIDRISRLYEAVDGNFFNQLRNLRDEARGGRMAFVFGGSRPLDNFHGLGTIFNDTCWIGPFAKEDQALFFQQHEGRLLIELTDEQRGEIAAITGGHAGFLKNTLEWIKLQGESRIILPDDDTFIQNLLTYPPIHRHCAGLWENLRADEQSNLLNFLRDPASLSVLPLLTNSGLLIKTKAGLSLFSPLWEAYLREKVWPDHLVGPMQIDLNETSRQVTLQWRGKTETLVISRPLVFNLLRLLAENPGEVYDKDILLQTLYPGEKAYDVFDDALYQLVTALRRILKPPLQRLCPDLTESCVQSVRGIGYRLIVDLPLIDPDHESSNRET